MRVLLLSLADTRNYETVEKQDRKVPVSAGDSNSISEKNLNTDK
jgi:hypothetical protein